MLVIIFPWTNGICFMDMSILRQSPWSQWTTFADEAKERSPAAPDLILPCTACDIFIARPSIVEWELLFKDGKTLDMSCLESWSQKLANMTHRNGIEMDIRKKMEQGHSFEQTAAAEIAFRWSQVVSKFRNHFVIQNPIKFTKYHQVPSLPPCKPTIFSHFWAIGDEWWRFRPLCGAQVPLPRSSVSSRYLTAAVSRSSSEASWSKGRMSRRLRSCRAPRIGWTIQRGP